MLANYFKTIFRILIKNKIYSFINIGSLAVGMAACILVLLFVEQQKSFDVFHKKADRIYRVINDQKTKDWESSWSDGSPVWGPILQKELPEIIEMTRIMSPEGTGAGKIILEHENKFYKIQNPLFADSNIFDVFDIKLEKGNSKTALKEPRSVILNKEMAKRYFPNENPVGKIFTLNMWINFISDNPDGFNPNGDYIITGVAKDMPANSHFHFDCLISFSSIKFWEMYSMDILQIFGVNTYLLLPEGYPYKELEDKISSLVEKHQSAYIKKRFGVSFNDFLKNGMYTKYRLQKLKDIHLGSEDLRSNYKLSEGGAVTEIYFFLLIAFAIILIASINFVNIRTAQSSNRAKEVGLRKVLGSHQAQLIRQFLAESLFISFCSLIFALLIAISFLNTFNKFIQTDLIIKSFINGWVIPEIIGLTLIVGLIAGIYPAILFSKFKPAEMLKNLLPTAMNGGLFRNGLVIFQLSVSVLFIFSSLVVYNQLSFIINKHLGFNKENVVMVHSVHALRTFGPIKGVNRVELFKQELLRNSNIISVSGTSGNYGFLASNPSMQLIFPEGNSQEEKVRIGFQNVDQNVIETFGLEIVAIDNDLANSFSGSVENVVLNEAAIKFLKLTDPIGKILIRDNGLNQSMCRIVGIVKDFHFQSLHKSIQPYVLALINNWGPNTAIHSVYIRINPAMLTSTLEYIGKVSEQFMPEQPINYSFLDEDLGRYYNVERQLSELFGYLSGIAIILSYLGIFGLASYMIHRRTKEIAIRKILGASIKDIVLLLSKKFFMLALISFIFSIPLSYYLMNNWLQKFAYHIMINVSTAIFTCLFILLVIVITVSRQAFKSAYSNPVDSLKYE